MDFETSEGTNLAFDLSPDGETIVFDLLGQLWVMPSTGGEARPLTNAAREMSEDSGPAFSPDGRSIAFQSDRPGGFGLWSMPAEGGEPQHLTTTDTDIFSVSSPTWSPDGREITYAIADKIYRLDPEASAVSAIPIDFPDDEAAVGLGAPSWSPSGERLAFSTGSGGTFRIGTGSGSRIWEVAAGGGVARPLTGEGLQAVAPDYSPQGDRLAFFARDSSGKWQLWVQDLPGGEARQLTEQTRVAIRRARWSPDGKSILYAAESRLWRVSASGGAPVEIPFSAHVQFERTVTELPPVRFPEPGTEVSARGFDGLALSPDGTRVAMLALGRLWVWQVGDSPRAVAEVPISARSVSWCGDGTEVVYTTGDLLATDVRTGVTRQLTALPGEEELPAWSPDGEHIAFVHGRECDLSLNCSPGRIALIRRHQALVQEPAQVAEIGEPPADLVHSLVWRPDSGAILAYDAYHRGTATLAVLEGEARELEEFPAAATFLSWPAPGAVVYTHGNRLWKAAFDATSGEVRGRVSLSEDPALYLSAASNGAMLYVSGDGLRLRNPKGEVASLGWPVTYRLPPPPAPLLIHDARIIDGTGASATAPRDLYIENGRIAAISPAGTLGIADGVELVDAEGRTIVPGFIDVHRHLFTRAAAVPQLWGALYYGTTTFRDAGSTMAQVAALRDLVDSGRLRGPRVVVAGFIFQGEYKPWLAGLVDPFNQYVIEEDEIARGVAIARAFGAEWVKHRGYHNWASLVRTIGVAHKHGLRLSGHCTSVLSAVAAGAEGQEHAAQCARDLAKVSEDTARLKAVAGMWVAAEPAMFLPELLVHDDPGFVTRTDIFPFLPGPWRSWLDGSRETLESTHVRWRDQTAALYASGVVLASGTDHWLPNMTQLTLETLVEAGLTPLEAITAATSTAAEVIGAEAEIGTVEIGKLADLVILDASPLEDIRNTGRIWQVIQGGRIVDREALLEAATDTRAGDDAD